MTLVGKIFTVLIFVMSILFMAFTLAVYATHQNWREIVMGDASNAAAPLGLVAQLENKEKYNQQLRDQKATLEGELAAEKKAYDQVRSKLESEYKVLSDNHTDLIGRHDLLTTAHRETAAAVGLAHDSLKKARTAVAKLRKDILDAQNKRDVAKKESIKLTEENHAVMAELQRLKKRQVTLSADKAKAMEVLRKFGLVGEPLRYVDVPPIVDGVVLAVPRQDLIEISIGEDEGLLPGHELEVVRPQGGYVGKIKVVRTDYDKSVCKILPNYRQSPVQVNDLVFSRLDQLR